MKLNSASTLALATTATLVSADGPNCIHLKGDKSYTWKALGDFTGEGLIDDSTHCFGPGSGTISIGAPNAPKGLDPNTRFECFFPASESDAEFYNCNLSLINGFSAAVTCETASGGWPNSKNDSAPLGCGYDLLAGCPEELKDKESGACLNKQGPHVESVGAVAPVFQACDNSEKFPNTAELYHSMVGAFKFEKSDFPLTCTVGKGEAPPAPKEKREAEGAKAGVHEHKASHQRSPMHARHVHARGLMDVVSS